MTGVSRIYSMAPAPEITGRDATEKNKRVSAALWHKRGMVLIDPEWLVSWQDQELVKSIALQMHGPKGGKNGA